MVLGLGVVSLAADMVYEGARSVTGPLLASLGVPMVVAGLVTGLGEAVALVLRLPFGARADRSGRYWPTTIAGYGLTAVGVPLLALTPLLATGGAVLASVLLLLERFGKAVRSPSKSVLLARAAQDVGLGRGLADPSGDIGLAWNFLDAPSRAAFRAALGDDDATWLRGRGWALRQALLQLPYYRTRYVPLADHARATIRAVLEDAGLVGQPG